MKKPGMEQGTLKEADLVIHKILANARTLRASEGWVTNGEWAVTRNRVSNVSIFSCLCCLKRDTGTNQVADLDDYAINSLFRSDAVMERWAHTEVHVSVGGLDYTRYHSDDGRDAYLRRDYAESLGLVYVYGDDPRQGLWDEPNLDDATVIIASTLEPGPARLPLADTLAPSVISHMERDADQPTIEASDLVDEHGESQTVDEVAAAMARRRDRAGQDGEQGGSTGADDTKPGKKEKGTAKRQSRAKKEPEPATA